MYSLICTSPIDGELFATRNSYSRAEIDTSLELARKAQRDWARRDLSERRAIVLNAVDALKAMNDDVVVELAHMMGRPVLGHSVLRFYVAGETAKFRCACRRYQFAAN